METDGDQIGVTINAESDFEPTGAPADAPQAP